MESKNKTLKSDLVREKTSPHLDNMKGGTGRRLAGGLTMLRKMWDRAKVWILLHSYLSDDRCVDVVQLPMGWIKKCKHRLITYYKIDPKEIRCPIDMVDYVMFEVAYIENLLPVIQMCAGFKVLLSDSGLYVYTRNGADIVVSKDITDLAAYVSAMFERHNVMIDKQRYKEQRKQELKSKYSYTIIT